MTASAANHNKPEIRVLVLTTSFPLRGGPPSGPFIQRLVENLPSGIAATVLTPCFERRQDYKEPPGYQVTCFRYAPISWQRLAHVPGGIPAALRARPVLYLLLPWFLLCMITACWRAVRDAELIHANWSVNGVVAGMVARLRRVPLVTTLRGEDVTRAEQSGVFRWFLANSINASTRVVTVSEAFQARIVNRFPDSAWKVRLVHNGVGRELLGCRARSGSSGVLNLVTVGSLIPRKSIATLFRALALLPAPDAVRLVVVGDGPERSGLERLASELGIGASVDFASSVPPGNVIRYLEQADVFVLCSRSEGRPNVVLEAMAAGLGVVATAIDGVTEIVRDGRSGLLFEPGDAEALAGLLERLRNDAGLRTRLAQEAREWIRSQNLFWDATGEQYAAIYRESLGGYIQSCAD